jgi:outer membrane protein assembly factor BamB
MQICVARRVFRSVLLALGVTALAGCSLFATKNPRYDPAPLTEYSAGISARVAWSASIGSGGGYGFIPLIVWDSVYAAAPNGSVAKLSLASGQVRWQASAQTQLSAGVGSDGRITAVASPDGKVIAFDDQGHEKWRASATSEVSIPPTVGGGVVVVRSTDYRIQAFDENTGELLWSLQRPGPALALKTSMQMIVVDNLIIAGLPNGKLLAINARTGNVQWEGVVSSPRGASDLERVSDVVGTPQVQGPLLCSASYQGRIVCFDVSQGGRAIWEQNFSSNSGIASDSEQVYAADQHDVVYAFSLKNGHQIWKQGALLNRRLTSPAAISQGIAVGDFEGYVHFLSRSDGHLLGRVQVGGGAIVSAPVASERGVLVQTGSGNLVLVGVN